MSLLKSDDFISDIERQFEWYLLHAPSEIGERYLQAVEATCRLIGEHPLLGPRAGLTLPQLDAWRFIVVFRPFHKHILFYETDGKDVLLRRAMHGHRNLPQRLIEKPGM